MRTASLAAGAVLLAGAGACGRQGSSTACGSVSSPALEPPPLERGTARVSRQNLRVWVELLASPELEGRHAGDPGARTAAALLAVQMGTLGLAAPRTAGGFCQGFSLLDGEDYNVVGHLARGAAGAARPVVMVGAHYDGQGLHPAGPIFPGADDNASGVAALLEVARVALERDSGGVDWVFAALGGEEVGQQGARAYLQAPSVELSRIELMINLDMVGRPLPGGVESAIGYLAAGRSAAAVVERVRRAAALAGIEVRSLADFGEARPEISDAEVLASRVPTILLSTALHEDHHELTDTAERIDYSQIERAADLVLALADIIASRR